jgi:putative holliday junction resolvase
VTAVRYPLDAHRMGLDVGARRIGVALAHVDDGRAAPLTTVQAQPPAQALQHLQRLIQKHRVVEIVIGLPLTLRGEHGPQADVIMQFAEALRGITAVPLQFFDERLTSAAAEQLLRESGVKAEKRKALVDQVAAAIILQDYLDARQRTTASDHDGERRDD